jgi:hypothetical protein
MSQQRLGAANEARAAATQQLIGGIGSIAGAAAGTYGGMLEAQGGGGALMRALTGAE